MGVSYPGFGKGTSAPRTSDQELDRTIARLVRGVGGDIPPALEERIAAAEKRGSRAGRARWRRPGLAALAPAVATGLAVLAAALLVLPPSRPEPPPISEIRTEFTIAGTDIKVIFFQKPDFKFFVED